MDQLANVTVDDLRVLAVFAGAPDSELVAILAIGTAVNVPAGQRLVTEDEQSMSAAVVIRGSIVIERGGERLNVIGAGQSFGEIGLLRRQRRTASARAETDATVLAFDFDNYQRALNAAPTFALNVLKQARSRGA